MFTSYGVPYPPRNSLPYLGWMTWFCRVFLPSLTVSLKNVSCQLWILPFSPTCCWECMYIYIYTQCIWRYIHRMTYKLAENHVMYNIYIGLYVTHIYIYIASQRKKTCRATPPLCQASTISRHAITLRLLWSSRSTGYLGGPQSPHPAEARMHQAVVKGGPIRVSSNERQLSEKDLGSYHQYNMDPEKRDTCITLLDHH